MIFFWFATSPAYPTSTWLRKREAIDSLQELDMFHDAFAHLPLLTNMAFTGFLENLAGIVLLNIDNPLAIDLLSRIYWFTVEFGMIRENGELRVLRCRNYQFLRRNEIQAF